MYSVLCTKCTIGVMHGRCTATLLGAWLGWLEQATSIFFCWARIWILAACGLRGDTKSRHTRSYRHLLQRQRLERPVALCGLLLLCEMDTQAHKPAGGPAGASLCGDESFMPASNG